jgi:hypothetical protein
MKKYYWVEFDTRTRTHGSNMAPEPVGFRVGFGVFFRFLSGFFRIRVSFRVFLVPFMVFSGLSYFLGFFEFLLEFFWVSGVLVFFRFRVCRISFMILPPALLHQQSAVVVC